MDDSTRLVAAGYDKIAERYEALGDDPVRASYVTEAKRLVQPGAVAVDLGCGTGTNATLALAETFRTIGVDISARSIELARARVPSASFVRADIATISLAPASVDLVTAFYSLIHVPRHEHAVVIRSIASWLRPDGIAIMTMGAGQGGETTSDDWHGAPMWWSSWGAATNRQLVDNSGFRVISAREEAVDEDDRTVTHLWVIAQRPRG